MTRTANALTAVVSLIVSDALAATTCIGPYDLARELGSFDDRRGCVVFVGRVTAVVSPSADVSRQVAVLEVQATLKGSPNFNHVWSPRIGADFRLVAGDVRVFFVDGHQTILGCSDYPGKTTEQVVREVKNALYGSAT